MTFCILLFCFLLQAGHFKEKICCIAPLGDYERTSEDNKERKKPSTQLDMNQQPLRNEVNASWPQRKNLTKAEIPKTVAVEREFQLL